MEQAQCLEKAHFQGPKLVREFWWYGVMTYHFGHLLTRPTLILSHFVIFGLKWGSELLEMRWAPKILEFCIFE